MDIGETLYVGVEALPRILPCVPANSVGLHRRSQEAARGVREPVGELHKSYRAGQANGPRRHREVLLDDVAAEFAGTEAVDLVESWQYDEAAPDLPTRQAN